MDQISVDLVAPNKLHTHNLTLIIWIEFILNDWKWFYFYPSCYHFQKNRQKLSRELHKNQIFPSPDLVISSDKLLKLASFQAVYRKNMDLLHIHNLMVFMFLWILELHQFLSRNFRNKEESMIHQPLKAVHFNS